jgi:peptidyl-tRNA hydrolase
MAGQGDVISSAEAGRQLGVSVRQVQRLAESGVLVQVGSVGRTKLIDAGSVQRVKTQGIRRGRPWSAETIAAALDLLSQGDTTRLSSVERKRLRERLAGLSAEDLVRATRSRADVRRYRTSASFLDRMRKEVAATGAAAIDNDAALAKEFGLAQGAQVTVDGYVDSNAADRLIRACHLVEDAQGNVTLRVTTIDSLMTTNAVAVAVDLAESLDPRERSAGLTFLRQRLKALR